MAEHRVTLTFPRTPIEEAYHVPELVIDAGRVKDIELAACRLFLGWQAHHPERRAILEVEGRPVEARLLNAALFRRRARATATLADREKSNG